MSMARALRVAGLVVCASRAGSLSLDACTRLLPKVLDCNRVQGTSFLPVVVGGEAFGACRAGDVAALADHGKGVFDVADGRVSLVPALEAASFEARTEAVAAVCARLLDAGIVSGWHDELVPVAQAYGAEPAFAVERCCYPLLGCKGYGVHLNGYVVAGEEVKLWVALRPASKPTWPGLLDHLAAGQQPFGSRTPSANVVDEAREEAGVPPSLARDIRPVGACSYRGLDAEGRLKNDCLFCYDLRLPADFEPTPVDGEVDSFELCALDDALLAQICADAFKPNVVLVLVDFFVRHSLLTPEMPDYLKLVASLRMGDCA